MRIIYCIFLLFFIMSSCSEEIINSSVEKTDLVVKKQEYIKLLESVSKYNSVLISIENKVALNDEISYSDYYLKSFNNDSQLLEKYSNQDKDRLVEYIVNERKKNWSKKYKDTELLNNVLSLRKEALKNILNNPNDIESILNDFISKSKILNATNSKYAFYAQSLAKKSKLKKSANK